MNLQKIKERLNQIEQEKKPSGFKRLWKPEIGTTQIRLVPNPKNRDYPFFELGFYYDLAPRTIISPLNFGNPDPVDEAVRKLKSTGDTEDWKLGRKLEARTRYYAPVLIRGREGEGVFLWGFGRSIFEELLKTMNDSDYGDITDLQNGTDLTIEVTKAADGGYPKTTFRPKRSSSPATTDSEVMKLLEDVPQPEDIWTPPTYSELETIFHNFINNRDSETEEETNETNEEETNDDFNSFDNDDDIPQGPKTSPPEPVKQAPTNVDDEFDKLFNM